MKSFLCLDYISIWMVSDTTTAVVTKFGRLA